MATSVGVTHTDCIERATPAHTQTWVNAGLADAAAIGEGRSKGQPGVPLHNGGNAPASGNLVEHAVERELAPLAERQFIGDLANKEVPDVGRGRGVVRGRTVGVLVSFDAARAPAPRSACVEGMRVGVIGLELQPPGHPLLYAKLEGVVVRPAIKE